MEQHPIPQNVTTFQFRLIGDMTIKQFGYLAGGVILAYVSYRLPLPFFFTWPLAAISALTGFGLAFVPIEERPMDVWIMAFLKNVYSPTQYVWQKTKQAASPPAAPPGPIGTAGKAVTGSRPGTDILAAVGSFLAMAPTKKSAAPAPASPAPPSELFNRLFTARQKSPAEAAPSPRPISPGKTAVMLSSHKAQGWGDWLKNLWPKSKLEPAHLQLTDALAGLPATPPAASGGEPSLAQPPPPAPTDTSASDARVAALEQSLQKLKKELDSTTLSEKRILELQKQLTEALSQKDKLEKEVVLLRQRVQRPTAPSVFRPAGTVRTPTSAGPTVRVITPEGAVHAGLPKLTTFPNIVTGIIKDGQGNLLSGVLVTVRDKNDIPMRALKTNKLGQFAASTPLPNGTYLIEVEDPRGNFTFDRVQVSVTGSLMPAIEIFAKSQRQIDRDKLAREIFGNPKPT